LFETDDGNVDYNLVNEYLNKIYTTFTECKYNKFDENLNPIDPKTGKIITDWVSYDGICFQNELKIIENEEYIGIIEDFLNKAKINLRTTDKKLKDILLEFKEYLKIGKNNYLTNIFGIGITILGFISICQIYDKYIDDLITN
jgi:hypothetical protein